MPLDKEIEKLFRSSDNTLKPWQKYRSVMRNIISRLSVSLDC